MSWTEPIAVMGQVIVNIDPSDDFIAVTEAEEAMKQTAVRRAQEADEVRESFRNLSRQLEAARMSATRPRTVPSEIQHTNILQELAEQQVSLGKNINEAQDSLRNQEAEVVRLRTEERELEARDEAAAHGLDSTVLRLQMAKGLGFDPVLDQSGGVQKILIMSEEADVHRVTFDISQTDFEIANKIWRLATV